MIRFIEMAGRYLDDTKSFGFLNTIDDTFISFNNTYIFDSVKEFNDLFNENCNINYNRIKNLIPNKWIFKNENTK